MLCRHKTRNFDAVIQPTYQVVYVYIYRCVSADTDACAGDVFNLVSF